ncbi:hypothetical protein JCGZ_11868 [Jatropha curcas]|uniref:Uncharacterized protein n=1 Tax=Jatropha curcas TaxID=180498 RepID=A0A067LMD4_JATCU|nr:hypothetical protein JCGZ_11868 [Jatropha curcas]
MEDMVCIGGIVLAETIRSLDRAALGFDDWTVSPIILQVWLKDHLQVVAARTLLPYNPSQYRMRRILITHLSTDAWTSWLIDLGPNEADADDEVGTDEEIVLAPQTGEVGESSAARNDLEDVAPRRRRDT